MYSGKLLVFRVKYLNLILLVPKDTPVPIAVVIGTEVTYSRLMLANRSLLFWVVPLNGAI